MKTLDPQAITPALEDGVVREVTDESFGGKTLADYDSPEFVLMDDSLTDANKIHILESWLAEKQPGVELDASGKEVDANAPYTRRVKLALQAVRDGVA